MDVCARTVARLLKKMGFSLRVNHKKRAGASHPNRDDQFQHIAELRERCAGENTPVISVDTKKKELVGAFRNPGAKWDHSPELVNDHDFPSAAEGRAIPYGIYDPRANAGTVIFAPALTSVVRETLPGSGPHRGSVLSRDRGPAPGVSAPTVAGQSVQSRPCGCLLCDRPRI